jgi:hypothetical protein
MHDADARMRRVGTRRERANRRSVKVNPGRVGSRSLCFRAVGLHLTMPVSAERDQGGAVLDIGPCRLVIAGPIAASGKGCCDRRTRAGGTIGAESSPATFLTSSATGNGSSRVAVPESLCPPTRAHGLNVIRARARCRFRRRTAGFPHRDNDAGNALGAFTLNPVTIAANHGDNLKDHSLASIGAPPRVERGVIAAFNRTRMRDGRQ